MTRQWLLSAAVLLVLSGAAGTVRADETEPAGDQRIAELIERLDAPRFGDRQAAQQELAEAGKSALPALEKAAASENRETAGRAVEVLQQHFEGDNEELKAAAKESLERLAQHESESVARRAKDILSPPQPEAPQPDVPRIPRLRLGGARIQIQVGGNAGGNVKSLTVKDVNGVKEIEAKEGGRKVKIVDDPAKGIEVEVTETKDGKETTKKYEAKKADELKTKHPEAYKLYEEFSKPPEVPQIPGIPPGVVPVPGGAPAAGGARRIEILRPDEVEAAREQLKEAISDLDAVLENLEKDAEKSPELKEALKKADAAKIRLLKVISKLEG